MIEKLGTDLGGVVVGHINDYRDSTGDIPEIEGAFEGLATLNKTRFKNQVYVISMCGEPMEELSRGWLKRHHFEERTGIPEDHLIYCREHSDKAPLATQHGITHFVDDRLEVLHQFESGELYLFRPRDKEVEAVKDYREHLGRLTIVQSWPEIIAHTS